MITECVFVAWLVCGMGCVTASNAPCIRPMRTKCEQQQQYYSGDKIVGGFPAEPGSTPWLVSLQDTHYEDPVPFCGGTLLSHYWVLTSASCVYTYQTRYEHIQVVLGEYDMTVHEGTERYRRVAFIIMHPEFDYYTHHADVALLRLNFYIWYTSRINVLKLPQWWMKEDKHDLNNEELHTIAGWGRVGEGGGPSSMVRMAQVPILPLRECQAVYPDFTNTMICAGNLTCGGLDSCQGDMGGALATGDGVYIRGVSSWSVGCGRPGYPGVYTDVEQVTNWICSVTGRVAQEPSERIESCKHL